MDYNEWLERTKVFEVLTLRKFKGCNVKIGAKVYAVAAGNTFLLGKHGEVGSGHLDGVFCPDAVENVDFIRMK